MARKVNPLLKSFRPVTPSLRYTELQRNDAITKSTPEKKLTETRKRTGGRNSYGRMTMRRIGGGHKQRYRFIDFKRNKHGVVATVEAIEYDPIRTANLALVKYADGEKRYIIAPSKLSVGDTVQSGPEAPAAVGNSLPLANIPLGADIHNIELMPGKGAQIARTAGAGAVLNAVDKDYALIKMPSGEIRKIHAKCYATIGVVGNSEHKDVKLGKAGRNRWLGRRPRVRGMVMNPIDHPNGGGNGKSKGGGGRQHPMSPWSQPAKGYKTRSKYKPSNKFIVTRRKSKKKKR
ncbi:MAG: 50S ribosomal protein L2 [Verrucomicrobiota bacterium]